MTDAASMLVATLPDRPSAWDIVDALVPAWADLAMVSMPDQDRLTVAAFAHIDPLQMKALREFQQAHTPRIDDPHSAMARVFRTGLPLLMTPDELRAMEEKFTNPVIRGAVRVLGPRTTLIAPLLEQTTESPCGVLLTAMSTSGRRVDADDLQTLIELGRLIGARLK
jgi:hypothetical protein